MKNPSATAEETILEVPLRFLHVEISVRLETAFSFDSPTSIVVGYSSVHAASRSASACENPAAMICAASSRAPSPRGQAPPSIQR
eukprot:839376-Pyramimonas_sp.AAC.1